jgi:allophanate hydrolase subunit 2
MSGLRVLQPGILSLPQDSGRFGMHGIGLTTGGPLDCNAFRWANRLCGNDQSVSVIEVTIGGLILESLVKTTIALTGAKIPLMINKKPVPLWQLPEVLRLRQFLTARQQCTVNLWADYAKMVAHYKPANYSPVTS